MLRNERALREKVAQELNRSYTQGRTSISVLIDSLNKQGISLEVSEEAKKHLALLGFTPKYGARPINGVLRNYLRRPISKLIISNKVTKGNTRNVGLDNENNLTWNII